MGLINYFVYFRS